MTSRPHTVLGLDDEVVFFPVMMHHFAMNSKIVNAEDLYYYRILVTLKDDSYSVTSKSGELIREFSGGVNFFPRSCACL
jgi:hypothetical protein